MAQAKARTKAPRHVAASIKMQVEIEGSAWDFELTGYDDDKGVPDNIAFQLRSVDSDKPWGVGGEIPMPALMSVLGGLGRVLDSAEAREGLHKLASLGRQFDAPPPPTPEQQAEWKRAMERSRRIGMAVDAEIIARVQRGEITTPEDLEAAASFIRAEVTAQAKAEEQAGADGGEE